MTEMKKNEINTTDTVSDETLKTLIGALFTGIIDSSKTENRESHKELFEKSAVHSREFIRELAAQVV